jgi:hypothetical protein
MAERKDWDRAREGVIYWALPGSLIHHFVADVVDKRKAYGRYAEVWATWNDRTVRVREDVTAAELQRQLMGVE